MSILSRTMDPSFRDPAILSTLPFDQLYARRYKTEEALERTGKRWAWFEEALKTDPTLGTLNYLPLEIRHRIWQMVLQFDDTLSVDGLWEYDHSLGAPFNLSAYYFGFGRRRFLEANANALRLVSSSVRTESDDVFLSMRTFRFNRPESLNAFVGHLTHHQLSRLRSIAVGLLVCTSTSMEVWLDPLTRLPPSLQDIHFRIYPAPNNWFDKARNFQGGHYNRHIPQEEFHLLEAIVKNAIQSAPRIRVTIRGAGNEYPLSARSQVAIDTIIGSTAPVSRLNHPAIG